MSEPLNEEQRQSYLTSMGYQVYYPRYLLPGAKASPRYKLPVKETGTRVAATVEQGTIAGMKSGTRKPAADVGTAGRTAASPAARERARRNRPDLESKPGVAVARSRKQSVATVDLANGEQPEQLNFSLLYYSINSQLGVMSEIPPHQDLNQKRQSRYLLAAILRSLMSYSPDSAPELKGIPFNWPLTPGTADDEPIKAAALTLQGFTNERQDQDKFVNLLVLTSQLAPVLTGVEGSVVSGDITLENFNCQITLTHRLDMMLKHPTLKKEVWAHLQPLRKRVMQKLRQP